MTGFAPPPAFGPFRVLHQIGVGSLGPVFRTYEPARDRLVAVKVFRLALSPGQAQALADQLARAAEADLFHPSIVEPIAGGVEGADPYRAEEYIAAESLDAAMRREPTATLDVVLRIVGQVGAALDAARAAGVGHGALTPRDIFVSADEARASGFGIIDALERVGLPAPGRAPYSAPERIAGESWDLPADVFSLAAIASELLTGHSPGSARSDQPLASSRPVHDVLMQAMHEDPDQRFGTGQAFVEAFAAAAAIDPASPPPPSPQGVASDTDVAAVSGERVGSSIRMIPMPLDVPQFADEEPADQFISTERGAAAAGANTVSDQPSRDTGFDSAPESLGLSDDVSVERDEDVAQWALSLEEAHGNDAESTRYRDVDLTAAKDALIFDAAEMVLQERDPESLDEDGRRSYVERQRVLAVEEAPVVTVPPAAASAPWLFEGTAEEPQQVIERAPSQEPRREIEEAALAAHSTPYTDRPRLPLVPIAAGLVAALLVGILTGYLVWGRDTAPQESLAGGASSTSSREAAAATGRVAAPVTAPAAGAGTPPAPAKPAIAAPADLRSRPSRAAATPAARTGKLNVQSTPAGANVLINGRWSGRTPFTRDALALGAYTVRITMPGFESRREQFSLTAGAPSRSIALQLRQTGAEARASSGGTGRGTPVAVGGPASAADVGALEVDSRPAGARVLLDGVALGSTPLKAPDVKAGGHSIRLELAGHQPWTQNTQVVRGRTTRVAGSLEPIR